LIASFDVATGLLMYASVGNARTEVDYLALQFRGEKLQHNIQHIGMLILALTQDNIISNLSPKFSEFIPIPNS
jgi:hypothetical protein